MNKLVSLLIAAFAAAALSSCDKFLDRMPDNRTIIDSPKTMQALLTSAYPATDYMLLTEFMSDNVDDYGKNNPYTDRFIDQVFAWEDVTESDNEDPESLWENSYMAISAANEVIKAIENMGGVKATGYYAEMAEALLCRAYNHFILVNVFAMQYNAMTADTDQGIPYITEPETTLNPSYERGTVAHVYEMIDKDLQAALPYVSEVYYTVPKYHFNVRAANAFAARFYLYYEQYAKSIQYADRVLGDTPKSLLRDWSYQAGMTQDYDPIVNHYIDETLNCNLLLLTAYSKMGLTFGPYRVYSKYSHGEYLANRETGIALADLWGGSNNTYHMSMKVYSATNLDKTIFWKLPYLFEYTDPVARIGYYRTVYPAFSGDMVLLERAEANIILGNYDIAVDDINLWIKNIAKSPTVLTKESIASYFNGISYSTWNQSTLKKHLNPPVSVQMGDEGGMKECLLQCILAIKRVESLGQGLRWFDIKRYDIEIQRRVINAAGLPERMTDVLLRRDLRRAVQIPPKVRDANLEPTLRETPIIL